VPRLPTTTMFGPTLGVEKAMRAPAA